MRIAYSPRAIRDLDHIAAYYRTVADQKIAAAIAERIEYVVNRLGLYPKSAPRVVSRTDVRVALVFRYPYKIYYRVRTDVVEILHIRHTARKPWNEGPS
jgi:toxin ParE1/3/4